MSKLRHCSTRSLATTKVPTVRKTYSPIYHAVTWGKRIISPLPSITKLISATTQKVVISSKHATNRPVIGVVTKIDAPDARLDQTDTKKAIEFFTQFVELYPESQYAEQAYKEMNELYDKLAYKEYLSAKLYYNLGTYLGNNYLSAEIVAKNALKTYPTNSYQEELNWLILQAKYQQMVNSMDSKKEERAREAEDEYYSFITMYPESKHTTAAEKIKKEILKILQ